MTVVTELPLADNRSFTYADLESMPDDGRRYEVIDGCLLVTPGPITAHQVVVTELLVVLHAAAPSDVRVFASRYDVVLADDTVMEPDLLVARKSDLGWKNLSTAPLLAVEVLSRSTRSFDLTVKRERFERAGTLAFWAVDPNGPRLIAWELRDGTYVQVADVSGEEAFETEVPFPIRVVPSALV